MTASVFGLFKIGIGPSSSHTMGPLAAASRFVASLADIDAVTRVTTQLYGSLGATGRGHGTDKAILWGLEGADGLMDPAAAQARIEEIRQTGRLRLGTAERAPRQHHSGSASPTSSRALTSVGSPEIAFGPDDITFHLDALPGHPNAMTFTAWAHDRRLAEQTYFSIGGGEIREAGPDGLPVPAEVAAVDVPFPFRTGAELLEHCANGRTIPEVVFANECALRPAEEVRAGLLNIWHTMDACITAGTITEGTLPGALKVQRRAPMLRRHLEDAPRSDVQQELSRAWSSRLGAVDEHGEKQGEEHTRLSGEARGAEHGKVPDQLAVVDWVTLWALAVNEENAAGGRIVTAPTNGAAGVIPAVLKHCVRFVPGTSDSAIISFLLSAGAIGLIYKATASISGAEVGCQGEVGTACSMAAAGAAQIMSATPQQVTNAAEIGMEHNLGLTCDPVGGLVQIPCIERNAMAALKAIAAARLALLREHQQVSLDQVIATMMATGRDMSSKYKETSLGGLAVNLVEC